MVYSLRMLSPHEEALENDNHPIKPTTPWHGWAIVWGLSSAVGYTLANICLRSVADVDPFWVTTVKTSPTMLLALPWMWALRRRGGPALLRRGLGLGWLIAAALLGQLGGNVAFQWSLHLIGIALAVPLMMGCLVFSGALLGQQMLGERTGCLNLIAMAILAGAIAILTSGADDASHAISADARSDQVVWAVIAASVAGVSYAVLGVSIRHCVAGGVPPPSALLVVSTVGVLGVGTISWWRLGWEQLSQTAPDDLQQMVMAGVWNALAFVALTKSLQIAPLYYTNALNASQIAMASIAGVWFFNEVASDSLVLGVGLTAVGLLLIRNNSPVS